MLSETEAEVAEDIVANIRRGLGRIRKVLKVWGYMVGTITIFFIFTAVMNFLEGYIEEAFEVLKWGIIAWAPFLYGSFGQSVGHYFAKEVKDHSHLSTDFGTVQGVSVTKFINNRHRLNCFLGTIRND